MALQEGNLRENKKRKWQGGSFSCQRIIQVLLHKFSFIVLSFQIKGKKFVVCAKNWLCKTLCLLCKILLRWNLYTLFKILSKFKRQFRFSTENSILSRKFLNKTCARLLIADYYIHIYIIYNNQCECIYTDIYTHMFINLINDGIILKQIYEGQYSICIEIELYCFWNFCI